MAIVVDLALPLGTITSLLTDWYIFMSHEYDLWMISIEVLLQQLLILIKERCHGYIQAILLGK
jgi:hypothetical protein